MALNLKGRSFLTLMDFAPEEIRYMLDLAHDLKAKKACGHIAAKSSKGKNVSSCCSKRLPPGRRCAFEVAGHQDGGAGVTFPGFRESSQMGTKESLEDSAKVLGRFFDGIEYRGIRSEGGGGSGRVCRGARVERPDGRGSSDPDSG